MHPVFKNLAKPRSTEKRKWIMFSIELFWGSIFKGEEVSHQNPRYEETLEINPMHSLSSWNQISLFSTLLLGASKVWPWECVGGRYRWFSMPTLRLISWNKVHNHAKFTYINKFHKFWWIFECGNSVCKNWQKLGKFPGRPGGLPSVEPHVHVLPVSLKSQNQANSTWFHWRFLS